MKLRLPHRLHAALVAALASVSFTTLCSGALTAAFFLGSQAFAEEAANKSAAPIDIEDTNLDAQAAIDEEEGKGEAKEPGSTPTGHVGSNGVIGSSDDFDRQSTAEATTESSIDTENVGTAGQANYTGTSADLPSNDLGFTSNPYASGSDTSNGSDDFSLPDAAPAAAYVPEQSGSSAEEGDSAAGTGSSSNSASPVSVFGNTGLGAFGGSMGSGFSGVVQAAPNLGAGSGTGNQTLHVYILTGQSNSLGAVKSVPLSQSKLDTYFTEGAMLWNANLHKGGDYYVPAAQQAWQDVEPQVPSISSGGPSNLCMGPEYGFVHMLTRLSAEKKAPAVDADHLAIIKFSLDGGGNGYWVKGGSGSSYANMLDAAKRALVAAKDKGFTTISLDGLMYLQGESDNGTEAAQSATRYQAFITNLSTDLETWMQQENITGITVSFDSNSVLGEPMLGNDTRKTVNNNFINLAGGNADKNGYGYVYTDDLGNIGDNLHFTGEAQLTIGARYAYAFAVQNDFNVGAVRGANKSAALDTAGAWWMEAMPLPTDVVKWDVSSCSTVNTISSSLTVGGILVEDPYNNAVFITGGSLDIGASGIEVQKGALNVSSAVNVASSQSWRSQNGFAINTTGNVTIASDATLTIQDGAVVNFHSIGGAGNLTLGTGSGLVSLGMSAQDFAAATPVGEAHYTEGDNGFFNGSRSIITVSGNLVIADGTTVSGMDGLTGAIFSVSDDHHSLYAAATSQTDYFVRSGKITYAAGTNAYAATGLILVDKGSGAACLSLETNLKDNVSIQVSGTGNAIEIAEGVNLAAASLQIGGSGNVTLKGNGFYTSNSVSHTGITLDPSNWHGVYMLKGVTIGTGDTIKNCTVGDSYVGLCGVSGVDSKWNGTQEANIWLQDNGDTVAWTWNNGSSNAFSTETFAGKIAGDGTLKKTTAKYRQNYTFKGDISDWTGTLWIADQDYAGTMTYQSAATVINSEIKNTSAQGITLALGETLDGTNAYTLNNSANVATLSADGRTLNLGTNEKADGTKTVGNLTVSGNTTLDTLTLGSGTTATFGGTTNLAGVNGTGGTLVVGGGNLNVSGSVGGTVAINLQSGSVGNISIASGSNVTLSQAGGTYGTVTVAADTTLTLGSALNVADMTFGSGAKLDATVDFMRSVTYSGTSTGYRDNSDTENGYQQYSDASFTLVTKSAGTAGDVQGAGLLESWTLESTASGVVAHGGTVNAGKYYVNTSVDYDAASSTSTAYTGASELVLNSANATLNLLSNLNANACSGGITTAGGATAIASTINIGSGVTLNADQLTRKGSDTVTLAGSGAYVGNAATATASVDSEQVMGAGVSLGTDWRGTMVLSGGVTSDSVTTYTNWGTFSGYTKSYSEGGTTKYSTVRLNGVGGYLTAGDINANIEFVGTETDGTGMAMKITAGGKNQTNTFKGSVSGNGDFVLNKNTNTADTIRFSGDISGWHGNILAEDRNTGGTTLRFMENAQTVNVGISNNGRRAIAIAADTDVTFNGTIGATGSFTAPSMTVASGKSATFNGNTSVSSLSASGADVALGSGASLAVAGATTVDNLSLAGGNTVAFGNGLTYDTLSAEGVSSMSLSGAVSMGEYLMLGKGTLSVNNVQLDLSRDAWDAALDREGSQYSDGESTVNGYATGMKLILARASRIDGAGYAAASGGSLAGMNLSIEVYGAEEDPECSVDGYAQHLVAMGADTSHTYFVNTEAEYDSSSATSSAATRLVMNRANASLSLASNLDSSVCVGGIVVEAQGTSVIVKSGVDLSAGDIHYGDTLTSICVEDQGTLVLEGFGGSAIALDRLTLEDGSALDLAALTTFAPAQQPVLLQGMGGGSGMMKVNSNAIGDFSGISLLGDAAPGSPQTVVLATASNGIELGSNVDLKNLVIPEQYQAKLSTQAADGGGYNLVLTLGAASNDLVWDNASSNGLWDSGNNWHASGTTTTGTTQFSEGDNVQFSSGFTNTVALNGDVNAGTMTIDNGVEVTVNTADHNLSVTDLDSTSGTLNKTGAGTATFGGSDGVTLTKLTVSGGTAVFDEHVTISGNDWITVSNSGTEIQLLDGMTFNGTGGGNSYVLIVGASGAKAVFGGTTDMSAKNIGGAQGATIELAENANVTVLGVLNTRTSDSNQNVVMGDGSILTAGEFRSQTLTLGSNAVLNLTGSSNRDSKIVNVTGSGNINVQARTLTLSGSSNYTGNVTLSNAANLEINATNFVGKIANTGTGSITMYGTAGQVANADARISVTKKTGQQLVLAAGSEKAISKVTVAAGDGQWLLAEGIGENTDGLYTDIHLGGKGLILSQPNTTVNIGSLSGVSGTTVQGDYNTGGGRVLAVHQDEDAEYAGIFTSGSNNRSVGLNKYGSSTLTLTGANASTNALNIYEGAIKLDGADAKWSGAATVYGGGTLELTSSVAALASNVTINSGGTLTLGNYKDDAVTATNLTLASGSILDLSNLSFTGDEEGEITLIAGGTITATDPGSVTLNFSDPTLQDRATLSKSGTNLVLTFTPLTQDLIWDGTNGAMWDTGNNWHTAGQAAGATAFRTDANVQFTDDYTATATLGNDVTAGNMVVDSGATATVNTAGHSLTATSLTGAEGAQGGNLVKQGVGTATFNGDINLSGIEVQGGTVYVTDTDTTRGNVGEIKSTQGAALELANVAATISGNGTQQLKGDLTIGNGALVTVTNTDNLDYNSTSTVTVGAGGELHFENGRWTVGANNKLELAGGSITGTGDSSNGALDFMNANTVSVTDNSTISAPVRLRNSNVTFEVDEAKNLTISSVVNQNSAGAAGSLTKTGDGTLTLTGSNTYTGGTTISNGALVTRAQTALGTGNVSVDSGATLQVETDLIIGGQSPNAGGTLTNNGTLSLQNGVDLELYAGTGNRTYELGNVVVDGSASIMNRWNPATQNISSISGDAEDTLTLISNHCGGTGTWNIGQSNVAASPYSGKLVLQVQDTDGDNNRVVNFKILDGGLLSGATVELKNGPFKTSNRTMTNNVELVADQVTLGGLTDGEPIVGTGTRTVNWNLAPTSQSSSTLELNGTSTYSTGVKVGANVSINKTGAGSQSFTGDLSAMNGTVTATAGTLTLDNSSSTKGALNSVTVNGGTLALDNMNVTDAVTLSSGTLDLMSTTNVGSLNMTGGTLAMDGTNRLSSSTGNLAFTSGMLDLSGMTVEAGHDYILATTTSGSLTLGADVDFTLSNPSLKDQFTLQKQGESLVLTFVTTEDLIWSGGNGNWSSNNWHTETAPDTPVSFTDGHNVTFESGEAVVTLTQNVTAPTTTLESGAVVKVVSEQGGNYTLDTTLKGAGTFVLAAGATTLPSEVTLSSTDWHGVVRINGSIDNLNINTLGNNIASTIEFAGMEGSFCNPNNDTITLARNVVFSNVGDEGATPAIKITQGYSRAGGFQFSGNVSGTGTVQIAKDVTQHFTFSGDVSHWDGEIKVTNCGSGNDGSWVKFTGSATEVNAAINQTGGGDFRVIADADTTFKDDISVTRMEVTTDHTATLEGDVTLTGSQGKGITGSGAVNVAQGGTLTFASGVDTISGTLTVSDGATLKLSEMNTSAITTSGTLTLNGGSTLDLSSLTSITGRELTPITLVKGGTITDTDLGGVKLVFAGDVTGGKLSVQNNALVLTFIEPGKTLIWDNNAGTQTWSNAAGDANWHTPNNPYTHIGFEEYDMVQFTGTGATSVHLGEDVTPARMDVASGKTLTVYTEGNDLTILQDLDARGASVVLNSDNKEEQATRIMGNTTLKNLTLVDGTASLGGHTEVSEKLTVKNDAEVTVSGTMATKALDISGGSSVSLAAGGTALTTKVAGGSALTVEANSSLGQLTLNSGTVTNNATLTLSNTQDTMVSGDSLITGTGTTITTGIRLADNSTLAIDGGQTVSITTTNGIIGGSGNGSELTLGNVTMTGTASWSVADTVDSVNLTSTTGSGTVFDTNAHSVTVNAGMSGTGNLTKTGHGTLTLNGSNSFSGDTTVSSGTLKVNNAAGLTSSERVNVADGATLWFNSSDTAHLSGTTVIANGGMLHLSSENALTTTGTLTLNDTSVLNLSGLEIKQNQLEYVLASGRSITLVNGFDMDDVIVEYGTHPETGSTPSIIVRPNTETGLEELVLTYDVIDSNSLYWNGGTADWTGSGTWHDVTTKDSTTFAEFDDVFFTPTEYSDSSAASVQANVTQNTNVHEMNIVAREGEGADKNTVNVVVNTGQTLTVDFLEADVNTAFIKQGAGTAIVGIDDPHFGADVSVTAGTLTTQFLDLAGNGMVVDGELNRTGGTLNLEVGRAETPTDVEFRQSVSGVKNFTVNEGSNATFTGQVTVPNGQDIYMDVASDASVTFAHDVSLASNSWVIQGDGTVNFDGPTVISEVSGHFNQLNGNAKVNFNSTLSTAAAQMDIRLDPGTNLYIKELDMVNSNQDTLYFTFKNTYGTQVDRDSVQIDKMVVDGSRGIGTNLSSLSGLEDYQAGGDINIKQLVNAAGETSDDIARLCNYVSRLQAKVTPNGWGIAQVFNLGEATQEGAAFEGIIRLQDSRNNENWYGTEDAHKKTVLVLNDEYVSSEAVIELKNYSNYSDFAIGINTANAKVTAIEDYDGHAMQNGNYAKVFSGAMDSANTAVPQSDDTLRTLELIGKKDDTADTVHSTSAGVDRNLNIVKDGAGTQVFSGDSSNFDGSVNAKDGLLKFLNTASLTVQDLTLAANGSATDGTLAVRSDAAGSNVGTAEVHGTLKANSGSKLASNLTLATDSVLDVRSTLKEHEGEYADKTDYVGGLDMLGNSLTLQSGAYLSDADRSTLLSMQWGERYELVYGLSSLTLGDYTTTESFGYEQGSENNIEASQYFQNLQEDDYYLCYSGSGAGPDGTNVGVFYIFKAPEPTTSTLSLLALAALAARRRRK